VARAVARTTFLEGPIAWCVIDRPVACNALPRPATQQGIERAVLVALVHP